MGRNKKSIGIALLAGAVLVTASACGGNASANGQSNNPVVGASGGASSGASAGGSASATASPTPTHPSGPPLQLDSISPVNGGTVGVAMPISIVFTKAVAKSARKAIEQHLTVTSSTPVTGAWHWFSSQRVDFRPQNYWASGTKVTVKAALTDVGDGNGRYGTHDYTHSFTIGSDIETKISVTGHSMKVYKNNALVKTMPIDAGSPTFPSWDGTMAIIGKAPTVRMKSCSVHIACDPKDPNFYDVTLPWDVQLTYSGTYVHYSTGDPYPGHSYGSHGCVHLSLADSKWYYNYVKTGDPVTITGSPRGKAAGDNGYAAFNLSWSQWLADSALGAVTTASA